MSSFQDLPTKADFLRNVQTFENCSICKDPFDETHFPSRTKCDHVFGLTCLRAWIDANHDQSHTCPMCREPMFAKPPPPFFIIPGIRPEDSSGTRVDDQLGFRLNNDPAARSNEVVTVWLDTAVPRKDVKSFLRSLWLKSKVRVISSLNFYDSDIEVTVHSALQRTADTCHYPAGLHIKAEHWPAVKVVAEDMFRWHFEHENGGFDMGGAEDTWMRKMMEAIKW